MKESISAHYSGRVHWPLQGFGAASAFACASQEVTHQVSAQDQAFWALRHITLRNSALFLVLKPIDLCLCSNSPVATLTVDTFSNSRTTDKFLEGEVDCMEWIWTGAIGSKPSRYSCRRHAYRGRTSAGRCTDRCMQRRQQRRHESHRRERSCGYDLD